MRCRKFQYLLLAAAGGMVEAYSFTRLDNVFSNVQTANLLLCVLAFVQGNRKKALLYFVSVAAYIFGVMFWGMIGPRLRRKKWLVGGLVLAQAVLVAAALLSKTWPVAAVFLLALLCGFCFHGLYSQQIISRLKCGMVLSFGIGVLAGTMLLSVSGGSVLAAAGIGLILSVISGRSKHGNTNDEENKDTIKK